MKDNGFTFNLKIDFFDAREEDAELEKDPKSTLPGSFWQWSVGEVKDAKGTVLNMQSVIQRDVLCKNGGLKFSSILLFVSLAQLKLLFITSSSTYLRIGV